MDVVSRFSEGYWLRRCEGFRVETPEGFLGWVEDVWLGASHEPDALVVRSGQLGRRVLSLAGEVVRVVPERECVVLHSLPELIELDSAVEPSVEADRRGEQPIQVPL